MTEPEKPLRIVVGITGGIAAYKAVGVVRAFVLAGHDVQVIATEHALRFVGKPTLEAISRNIVHTDLYDGVAEVRHVSMGQSADLIVIAPATANSLAKLAAGLADDLLGNTVLAATAPIVLAPAMHTEMWQNPATAANVATLAARGFHFVGPSSGQLTGSDTGVGRMAEVDEIVSTSLAVAARPSLGPHGDSGQATDLAGVRILVTAGGTREPLDPVRFIGNRSSGRQGISLARAAAERGAQVTLIAAHVEVPLPSDVAVVTVETTAQLAEQVEKHAATSDVVIMAAAVADYRPATVSESKLKKDQLGESLSLELVKNPDILAGIASRARAGQIIVGFAAETAETSDELLRLGQQKIARKGSDYLVVNRVGWTEGFTSESNTVTVLDRAGSIVIEAQGSKLSVADDILTVLAERILAERNRHPADPPGAP